jgi:hypothetical protein
MKAPARRCFTAWEAGALMMCSLGPRQAESFQPLACSCPNYWIHPAMQSSPTASLPSAALLPTETAPPLPPFRRKTGDRTFRAAPREPAA